MKKILIIIFIVFFLWPLEASAQTQELQLLIDNLQRQIQALQQKITAIRFQLETLRSGDADFTFNLTRNLGIGTSGKDVKNLQKFLSQFSEIYPEGLTTGYFGPLTKAAVKRFQQKEGIASTGFIGPITLKRINLLLTMEAGKPGAAPPGPLIAPGPQRVISGIPLRQFAILSRPTYDLEQLALNIHNLINQKRREAGLGELAPDKTLAKTAVDHGLDQAKDNVELTNPDLLCSYPLIRHEGFSFGFTLKERLDNRNVFYRSAAENLAIVPLVKNLIYEYPRGSPPPQCPFIGEIKPANDSKEEKTRAYQETLAKSLEVVRGLQPIKWVNKEWRTIDELAEFAVMGWLNSSGHRKNLLTPAFNFGSVGIVEVNDYVIITHNFVGR